MEDSRRWWVEWRWGRTWLRPPCSCSARAAPVCCSRGTGRAPAAPRPPSTSLQVDYHSSLTLEISFRSGQVDLKSNLLSHEAGGKNISSSFLKDTLSLGQAKWVSNITVSSRKLFPTQDTFSLGQARWVSSPAGSRTKLLERAATSSSFS